MADEVELIDLRSDTVTRPTPEMRMAMAAAEVGDDVYGEDPTVNLLERRAAEMFGREAGLFVPTGTMGNQIALRLLTQPGQEIVCDARAHILDWEMATAAVFSGCLLRTVPTPDGILSWKEIEPVIYGRGNFRAATGAVEIENTHNMAGGRVTPPAVMEEICAKAKDKGLGVHLDGARIFNAATALGMDVKTLTRGFDTVMFCLSKGLCAPVGSMLVGSAERMAQARIYRKALGGRNAAGGRAGGGGADCAGEDAAAARGGSCQREAVGRGAGEYRGRGDRSGDGGDEHRDFPRGRGAFGDGDCGADEGARRADQHGGAERDPAGDAQRREPRALHAGGRGADGGD